MTNDFGCLAAKKVSAASSMPTGECRTRRAQVGDTRGRVLIAHVVQELLLESERSSSELNDGLAVFLDARQVSVKVVQDVRRIEPSADDGHGAALSNALGGSHGRSASRRVAHERGRRADRRPQMVRRGDEVLDVRREARVGELAVARSQSSKVERKHDRPLRVSAALMYLALNVSRPHVKQCANKTTALLSPCFGVSSSPASVPSLPGKSKRLRCVNASDAGGATSTAAVAHDSLQNLRSI